MWKMLVAVFLVAATTPLYAADPDRRLVTAKTAYVFAVDPLKDDQPVAACFAEHLAATTPYTAAAKDEAELSLGIQANISGAMGRSMGSLGVVRLTATLADGTVLWKGLQTVAAGQQGLRAAAAGEVACQLADAMAEELRKAMRKARDKK